MKKHLCLLLALLLFLSAAAVCAQDAEEWNSDPVSHWHEDKDGEKLDPAEHTLDERMTCTVCGSEIWPYEDGSAAVYAYDACGNPVRYALWDAQGALADEYTYAYEYDDQGHVLWQGTSHGDVLVESVSYALNSLGENMPVRQASYEADGSGSISEFDEWGNMTHSYTYDAMGNVTYEELSVYTYGEAGEVLGYRQDARFEDGSGYQQVYNEYGDPLSNVSYLPDGSIEFAFYHEYGYNEQGVMLWHKLYDKQRLVEESVYGMVEDEFGSWSYEQRLIEYHEDGARTVYEYDSMGELISTTSYDAQGKILE